MCTVSTPSGWPLPRGQEDLPEGTWRASCKCQDSRSHTFPVHAWSPPDTKETLKYSKRWEERKSKKQKAFLPRPIGPESLLKTQVFPHSLLFPEKQGKADGTTMITKVSAASEWLHLEAKSNSSLRGAASPFPLGCELLGWLEKINWDSDVVIHNL